MARLEIQLLGPFQAVLEGQPVTGFDSDKVRALLAYLAIESDRPVRREKLAGLLWPDFSESSARTNLRQALTNLRRILDDQQAQTPFLLPTRQTIQFNPVSDHRLDVAMFISLTAGQRALQPDITELETAIDLYRGNFMEGFSLPDSTAFEDWLLINRESVRRRALRALHNLARFYEEKQALDQALSNALRQLELDPYQEAAHQQVMRLMAQSGQRNEALAHYDTYRQLLEDELGVAPLDQTQAMYEQLRAGDLPGPAAATLILRREPRAVGESPYRGLAAFREEDAPFFFGREDFAQRLEQAVYGQRLVTVVVGPSGSGKSSIVFAGLLPRLRAQGDWLIVECRTRGHPIPALAGALIPALEPALREPERLVEAEKLALALEDGSLSLNQVALRALQKNRQNEHLLIVVDQFEELYTLCPEPDERHRFLDVLLMGAVNQSAPFAIVVTLRADFMSQAIGHRPFADALQDSALILGPMNQAELRAAIEQPAEKQGAAFEPGLVGRVLDDVGAEPGNLPLLEFALTLMWERLDEGWLTHEAYESIGGVKGALARYAEEIYARLTPADQTLARQALIQLVQPGESTEDTRRVASRIDFGEARWGLMQHLADKRLVVTAADLEGRQTAEIVHEALIRGWDRLQTWMAEDRAFRAWQERLRLALRGWNDSDRDPGALLRGAPLAEAENWLANRPVELNPLEREFIEAGTDERRRAEEAARAQEARERVLERAALRRLQIIVAVLIAASVMGITLTLAVFNQSRIASRTAAENVLIANTAQAASTQAVAQQIAAEQEAIARATQQAIAEEESDARATQQAVAEAEASARAVQQALAERSEAEARSLALAASARLALNAGETDLAIALALAANQLDNPPAQAQLALADAAYAPGTRMLLEGHAASRVYSIAVMPDGQKALTGAVDRSVLLWDVESGTPLARFGGFRGSVTGLDYFADREIAVLGILDGSLRLVDPETGNEIGRFLHALPNVAAVLTPDGRTAIWVAENGQIVQIDLEMNRERRRFGPPQVGDLSTAVSALAVHPDGLRLLAGHVDGQLSLWNLQDGQEIRRLTGSPVAIEDLAFLPNGFQVVTTNANGAATLMDVETGRRRAQYEPQILEEKVFRAVPLPDGRIVLGALSGELLIWDHARGDQVQTLGEPGSGHTGWVSTLAVSPSGSTLISGGTEGELLVWDLAAGQVIHRLGGEMSASGRSPVLSVAFSRDSLQFVSGLESGALTLWDAKTGERVQEYAGNFWNVESVVVMPDGRSALATTINGGLSQWNWVENEFTRLYEGPQASAVEAAIRPGGFEVLSASFNLSAELDGEAVVWDIERRRARLRLQGVHLAEVSSLAVSPDGSLGLTGDAQGILALWSLETGAPIRTMDTHTGLVLDIAFSPDGTHALSGSVDGELILWELATGEVARRFPVTLNAEAVAFNPEGSIAFAGTSSGEIQLWDIETGAEISVLAGHTNIIYDLAISADGRRAISSAVDGDVRVWDLGSGADLGSLDGPGFQFGAALSPDGRHIYTGLGGDVLQWDVQSGQVVQQIPGHDQPIFAIVVSPDGKLALSTAGDPFGTDPTSAILWNLDAGREVRRLEGQGQFYIPAFDPDGRYGLVSSDGDEFPALFLWDLETGETINHFQIGPGEMSVGAVAVSPDGREILAGNLSQIDGDYVRRWDLDSGELLETYAGHGFSVADVAYVPDGEAAVTVSWDRSLILWDLNTGKLVRRMTGRNAELFSVAVHPSGRFALAGTGDGSLILWDLETGQAIRSYTGHTGPVGHVVFDPEGRLAITSALDGTVRLWRIDGSLEELIDWLTQNRYVRELTCDERALYQVEPLCDE